MSRMISRDPFARMETYRNRVYTDATCKWCGSYRMTAGHRKFLYEYTEESDGGRKNVDRNLFCSIECRRAHNE